MTNDEKRRALEELEDEKGRITPERVVEAAKEIDHPLHSEFEWDDTIAGHNFRIGQARTLIRSVIYEFTETTMTMAVPRYPIYLRDPDQEPKVQGYRALSNLRGDEDSARVAMVREFSVAAGHLRRARNVAVALGMESEIDELLDRLVAVKSKVETATSAPSEVR